MHRHASGGLDVPDKPAIVLVGNPNVGKSVVFSFLTGRYADVSNYPGTTVEVSKGKYIYDPDVIVIDTPGANSLHPQSIDEKVTREILLRADLKIVLQIADAKNLRRSLTLTTQLSEMGVQVVLVLNMMDEARSRGIRISADALSERIGVPVVETVAVEKKGFRKLIQALSLPPRVPTINVTYPEEIEKGIGELSRLFTSGRIAKRALSLMFLSDPGGARDAMSGEIGSGRALEAQAIAEKIQEGFSNPLGYIIGVSRSRTVDGLLGAVFEKDPRALGPRARSRLRKRHSLFMIGIAGASILSYASFGVDNLSAWGLHPTLLHFVFLMSLFAVLPYSFLEKLTTHFILGAAFLAEVLYLMYKFVGVFGAGTLVDAIEEKIFGLYLLPFFSSAMDKAVPVFILKDFLLGDYGLVSMGLTYSLAIVMPIVVTFFLAFGVLEDSGYLPRLSVIADKGMRMMGLNGKAVLPMVLGLGCDTMATLTTRILDSRKERVIATLLLALAIPCSAQLGVIIAIVSQTSLAVTVTVFLVILLQLFVVGTLSARIIRGRSADFIVELPPLRVPQLANILTKMRYRLKWFLLEAVPLFLLGTLVLFVLDKAGGIALIERAVRPVITGMLGLPVESTVAFIIGFFRRDYGAAGLFDLFRNGMLNHGQVAVSMVVITLFVPCVANFLVMIKERGLRVALVMVAFILPYAIAVGTLLNLFLRATGIKL